LEGDHDELRAVAGAEFEQDVADVGAGGRLGDEEPPGDLVVVHQYLV